MARFARESIRESFQSPWTEPLLTESRVTRQISLESLAEGVPLGWWPSGTLKLICRHLVGVWIGRRAPGKRALLVGERLSSNGSRATGLRGSERFGVSESQDAFDHDKGQKSANLREFLKALEATTAMKRRKISCSSLSFRLVISRLLARTCWSLAAVVSATVTSQQWPGGEVVISRLLPPWDPRRLKLNWNIPKW